MEFSQEQIMRIQMLEQESQHLNQQLQLIEQHTQELVAIKESLTSLTHGAKDVLINVGKKIYVPVEVKAPHLIVDIGQNYLLQKSVPDTALIIDEQLQKLSEGKGVVLERLSKLQEDVETLLTTVETDSGKLEKEKNKK